MASQQNGSAGQDSAGSQISNSPASLMWQRPAGSRPTRETLDGVASAGKTVFALEVERDRWGLRSC